MKKTIYNVYVVMESQEQCDRMKQLCIDNRLHYCKWNEAFYMCEDNSYLSYCDLNGFAIYGGTISTEIQVTESEFIELLKIKKNRIKKIELKKDNNQYLEEVKEEIKQRFANTISIPDEILDKGFKKTKVTINKFLNIK